MTMPTGSEKWNVEAIAHARPLLDRAQALGADLAKLKDSMAVIVWQWRKRQHILKVAAALRRDVTVLDDQIIDYWRIDPSGNQNFDPQWFSVQMSTRATVRDAIMRYVNDIEETIHEIALRGVARATLWVSALTLVFAAIAAVPELRNWLLPHYEAHAVIAMPLSESPAVSAPRAVSSAARAFAPPAPKSPTAAPVQPSTGRSAQK